MPSVLCIAGLDPSGGAGLAADIRALDSLGVHSFPVASTLTVQNSRDFSRMEPVAVDLINDQIDAALGEEMPGAVKVGMLANVEIIKMLAGRFEGIPVVVDPVMRSSTGFEIVDEEMLAAYKSSLIPNSAVVTPNASEASALAGMEVVDIETAKKACLAIHDLGPKAVVVKGGHFTSDKGTDILYDGEGFHEFASAEFQGDPRGTGCTFSSLIAGYLALGFRTVEVVKRAKSDMGRVLASSSCRSPGFSPHTSPEKMDVWLAVHKAASELVAILIPGMIAEVGNNIAFALENPVSLNDVCSLDSRFVVRGPRVVTMGAPLFGRDSHVGRVLLAAMKHDPATRCVINLRYSEKTLALAGNAGLKIASFDRTNEPASASSMEWGTDEALREHGQADLIFDLGSVGKEPVIRLLARDPTDALEKLRKIQGRGT